MQNFAQYMKQMKSSLKLIGQQWHCNWLKKALV